MNPELEETIIIDFVTSSPTTGAASDADSTPTCEIFEDENDTAILTPTVVKRTSKTGNYRISIACTTANGFEAGKSYNVIVSATVATVVAKGVARSFQVRTNGPDDLAARLPAALIGGRMDSYVGEMGMDVINSNAVALDVYTQALFRGAIGMGTADSGSTTTMVDAGRAEADVDYWKGSYILFVDGSIVSQCRLITGFNPATDTITFTPATTQAVTAGIPYEIHMGASTTISFSTGDLTSIADAILKRDFSAVSGEAARSLLNAARFLRNKFSVAGTTLTVTKEDDSTTAWTSVVTTDAAAEPITGSDPV